jgi:hypothetical protein
VKAHSEEHILSDLISEEQEEEEERAGDRRVMAQDVVLGDVILAEHVLELRGRARVWS